jgi:hypothetical protein
MVDRDYGVTSVTMTREALVSDESISMTDQEGESIAEHLASAERELSAFVTAVHQLFGAEQARQATDTWMEELERTDWPSESPRIDLREVTIAAAARLVGRDRHQLSETKHSVCGKPSTFEEVQ